MKILISGASIAGPALALWLVKYGVDVTIVEKASEVRPGGQAVDFKGPTHRVVLERMGILDEVRQARVAIGDDSAVVDAKGRKLAAIPAEFSAGEIEIARGDLARILYERTATTCEYLFSDSIAGMTETADGVEVTFERGAGRLSYDDRALPMGQTLKFNRQAQFATNLFRPRAGSEFRASARTDTPSLYMRRPGAQRQGTNFAG